MARRVTFPLHEHYFPPVELTKRDEEQFQQWAHALVAETLEGFITDQYMSREQRERQWKPLKQRNDLTVYRRRSGTEEAGDDYRYLLTGRLEGSLDEVMLGRYADTTDSFRRVSAVARDDLVDCIVLHTIARQSPANPFFYCGFKWMTVKSPGKGLVKNRDVCWFEQSGLTHDAKGKEIGYHIAQSVDLDACPPFDESVCVRARLSACYLFRRSKRGGTKVFMRGKNNAGGKVLDFVADAKSAELWLRVERAALCTQAIVSTEMVRAARLPSSATHGLGSNNRCDVCAEKTAGLMVSQKQCAVCRRVTCSRCVVKRRVLSSARDFLLDQRELFCKRCVRFFHEIHHRDPESIAAACAAAAAQAEPRSGGSSLLSADRRGYSHSSQASSESEHSQDAKWSHSSGSSASIEAAIRSLSSRVPLSPGSLQRQNSQRSVSSASTPIVLYEEEKPRAKKIVSISRRTGDSDVSTVASSVYSSRPHGYSDYSSYTDTASSMGDGSMYRDTADLSPHQSFQKHMIGSYAYQGSSARLDELSPTTMAPPPPMRTPRSYNTPEDMMQQMIRMNIMAEQARQMVQDNDKFTRKFNFY